MAHHAQAIAFQFPNDRRWILKGNQHSEQLPALIGNYPDALIVQTHRDPLAILQSVLTMAWPGSAGEPKEAQYRSACRLWVDRIERMLRAYIPDYRKIPGQSPRRPAVSGHSRGTTSARRKESSKRLACGRRPRARRTYGITWRTTSAAGPAGRL